MRAELFGGPHDGRVVDAPVGNSIYMPDPREAAHVTEPVVETSHHAIEYEFAGYQRTGLPVFRLKRAAA